jgi:hypothetical protein
MRNSLAGIRFVGSTAVKTHRTLAVLTIAFFLAIVGTAGLHHHRHDVHLHDDCSLCLFLVQPSLSGVLGHVLQHALFITYTTPVFPTVRPISLFIGKVFQNRAPPPDSP